MIGREAGVAKILPHVLAVMLMSLQSSTLAHAQSFAPTAVDWATLFTVRATESELDLETLGAEWHLEQHDVRLASGPFGKALDAGRSGPVFVPLTANTQPGEEVTVETWFYLEGRGGYVQQDMAVRTNYRGTERAYGLYVRYSADTPYLTWFVNTDRGTQKIDAQVPLSHWHHAAGTFDGQHIRLYVDGELVAEQACTGELPVNNDAMFMIGSSYRRGFRIYPGHRELPRTLVGRLDQIRVSAIARESFLDDSPAPAPAPTARLIPLDEPMSVGRAAMIPRADESPELDGQLDDAAWRNAPVHAFVEARQGEEPGIGTTFQLTFDDDCLYLAFQGQEQGQESFMAGPDQPQDRGVFGGDNVEIFLTPSPNESGYYQLAVNPLGGFYSHRFRERGPNGSIEWKPEGLRVAGEVHPDEWVVEVAIPFSAFGLKQAPVGTAWRANFCRTVLPSNELTAWAETGGGFHEPGRFGTLEFVSGPVQALDRADEQSGSRATITGQVLDDAGKPAVGVSVRTETEQVRTDLRGYFQLEGVQSSEQVLSFSSPEYESMPYAGKVRVGQPTEVLAPIVLQRQNPYRADWAGRQPESRVTWLASSIEQPPSLDEPFSYKHHATSLDWSAAQGERTSAAVAMFVHETIGHPVVEVASLRNSVGDQIDPKQIEVRWTERRLRRTHYARPWDEVFWDWDYIWPEAPSRIGSNELRHLVLTVDVPTDARGRYDGHLVLRSDGETIGQLPISIDIADFQLVDPDKRVGVWYRWRAVSEEQYRVELEDIRQQGGTIIYTYPYASSRKTDSGIEHDTSAIRHWIDYINRLGFRPPYVVNTSPGGIAGLVGMGGPMLGEDRARKLASSEAFVQAYQDRVDAITDLQDKMRVGEFVLTFMDEVMKEGKLPIFRELARLTKEAADSRISISMHNRDSDKVRQIDPFVDLRVYHGHAIEAWLDDGNTFEDLRQALDDAGDEAWVYYNMRSPVESLPGHMRVINGYWLWASPFSAHVPWSDYRYYLFSGSPFSDIDSEGNGRVLFTAPHPTRPEMVSTLAWECFREGYNDLRYLATLEALLAQARRSKLAHEAVRHGQRLIETYRRDEQSIHALATKLTPAAFHERRRQLINAIQDLRRHLAALRE